MNVHIKKKEKPFDIEVKRFYIPFEIHWDCPSCGEKVVEDFDRQYLSYPKTGESFTHHLYCYECDHEKKVNIQLDFSLKLID